MTQNNPEQCQADFWSCRNSGGALFHPPPPLAARGFRAAADEGGRNRWIGNLFLFSVSLRR